MTKQFQLSEQPVFEDGVFAANPDLFDRFARPVSDRMAERFREAQDLLIERQQSVTWPLLTGPGFAAGTHPGADNVFIETMIGSNQFVYDSDCLYVNPRRRVFAASDPPGITDCSRRLFERLDRRLNDAADNEAEADLEKMVNDLNRELSVDDGATLTLVTFPEAGGPALAFVAGDTLLYKGNLASETLEAIEGSPDFIGTPHLYLEPIEIETGDGDFLVIASDGILSIRALDRERTLEQLLRGYAVGPPEDFVTAAMRDCNGCVTDTIYDRTITRFGGSDNVSVVFLRPEELVETDSEETFILGGYLRRWQ